MLPKWYNKTPPEQEQKQAGSWLEHAHWNGHA
jgi:hypothetical protein